MTGKDIKNVTASVLPKLRNTSESSGAPFQQVLQLYAIERFLYRISILAMPALRALSGGEALPKRWKSGRGWVPA